jgi:hypothetical protein
MFSRLVKAPPSDVVQRGGLRTAIHDAMLDGERLLEIDQRGVRATLSLVD